MKSVLILLALIFSMHSTLAQAQDLEFDSSDRILICSPSQNSKNGLGLAWARIQLSRDNPEADLLYRVLSRDPRRSRKTFYMHYDTTGDGSEYELTPDSADPSAFFIGLKKMNQKIWEATFINNQTDTISVLKCTEGEPSPLRG